MSQQPNVPIQETLGRVAGRFEYLDVRYGPQSDDWQLASSIVADPEALSGLLDILGRMYGTDDRQVAAAMVVLSYFWNPVAGAVGCFLTERRVPDLTPDALAVSPTAGIAFLSPRCWALPDDPDADHPCVTVVPDLDALRTHLIDQLLHEHAAPLFATLRSVAPYGINGMRANFVDRLAHAVLLLSEQLGDLDLARQEIPLLVHLAHPKPRTGVLEIEHAGKYRLLLNRGGCCLNYRIPGEEKCDTCCLRPRTERIELFHKLLDSERIAI